MKSKVFLNLISCFMVVLFFLAGCQKHEPDSSLTKSEIMVTSSHSQAEKEETSSTAPKIIEEESSVSPPEGTLDSSIPESVMPTSSPSSEPISAIGSLSLEKLRDENGDFAIVLDMPIYYGMSVRLFSILVGTDASVLEEGPEIDGESSVTYPMGEVELLGYNFQQQLEFRDDKYSGSRLILEAEEDQNFITLYEELYSQLDSLYGLGEERILEDVGISLDNGAVRYFDYERFATVYEEEGERSTGLSLSGYEKDGAIVRVELILYVAS